MSSPSRRTRGNFWSSCRSRISKKSRVWPPTIAIEAAVGQQQSAIDGGDDDGDLRLPARVLFARARERLHCWICGRGDQKSQTPSQIVDAVMKHPAGTKVMILSPLIRGQKGEHKATFNAIHKQGFVRARVDGEIHELPSPKAAPPAGLKTKARITRSRRSSIGSCWKPEIRSRAGRPSIETALKLSQGLVIVAIDSEAMLQGCLVRADRRFQ